MRHINETPRRFVMSGEHRHCHANHHKCGNNTGQKVLNNWSKSNTETARIIDMMLTTSHMLTLFMDSHFVLPHPLTIEHGGLFSKIPSNHSPLPPGHVSFPPPMDHHLGRTSGTVTIMPLFHFQETPGAAGPYPRTSQISILNGLVLVSSTPRELCAQAMLFYPWRYPGLWPPVPFRTHQKSIPPPSTPMHQKQKGNLSFLSSPEIYPIPESPDRDSLQVLQTWSFTTSRVFSRT